MTDRDKRALLILGLALAGFALFHFASGDGGVGTVEVVGAEDSIPLAERRLLRIRELKAAVPGMREAMERVSEELAEREKGLLQGETAAQAQAQLLQTIRRLGASQSPPLQIQSTELGQARALNDDYGEVTVSVSVNCRIEQVVNLLADLSAQPELIATSEVRLGAASDKDKNIPLRLTVSGVVPRKLIPEKRGLAF